MKLIEIFDRFGIPYAMSGKDLLARYGMIASPFYGMKIVPVSDAKPLIEGQVLSYEARYDSEFLPAYLYRCYFDNHPDRFENFKITLSRLTEVLGEGISTFKDSDSSHEWHFENGLIRLEILFLRPQSPGRDLLQDSHADMLHYCWLHIMPDFRYPLSAQEQEWIVGGIRPFSRDTDGYFVKTNLGDKSFGSVTPGISRYYEAGDFPDMCGITTDSQALIAGKDHDILIIQKNQIEGIQLRKTSSVRGGKGSSHIGILYRDSKLPELDVMSVSLYFGDTRKSLNKLAQEISEWAGVPVRITQDNDY